jgi:methyl-accepting chemotaxis protein
MRFTVKLKIAAAMFTAFMVALLVGGVGLDALSRTFADVDGMYHQNLIPIVDVGDLRANVATERGAVSRTLLFGTPEATADLRKKVAAVTADMDTKWNHYYPAMVSSDEEMAAAKKFIAARTETDAQIALELDALAAGHREQATDIALHPLAVAFDAESNGIMRIVTLNQTEAAQEFTASEQRHTRTLYISAAVLLVGLIALLVTALLLIRAVMSPLDKARKLAESISQGSLNNQLQITGNDELSDTLRSLASMDTTLTAIVGKVRDNTEQVTMAAQDISQGNDDLSQRTQEQASSLEETAASMEEMAASVKQNAEGAKTAHDLARSLRTDAETGAGVATSAIAAMVEISSASKSISEIAVLIDEIAFQTNLLALNAAVEAARAGDQGRGFAVVAAEVRNLAHRSAKAAREIKVMIADAGDRVVAGSDLVQRTGESLKGIQAGAARVADIIAEIAAASQQQSAGIDQVTDAVTTLDEVTQQNAALVEEASAASRNTLELARELMQQVAFFKVAEDAVSTIPVATARQHATPEPLAVVTA